MSNATPLADYDNDLVRKTAERLTDGTLSTKEQFDRLLAYVRDEIQFGFPATGDLTKASETIELGIGQCNTKATLLRVLCKVLDIPARIHISLISKEIQRGFCTGIAYRLMPDEISHSWLEVEIDGDCDAQTASSMTKRCNPHLSESCAVEAGKPGFRLHWTRRGQAVT